MTENVDASWAGGTANEAEDEVVVEQLTSNSSEPRDTPKWWRGHLNKFRVFGRATWHDEYLGPPPTDPGCRAPSELLIEFGYREGAPPDGATTAGAPVDVSSTSDAHRDAAPLAVVTDDVPTVPSDEPPTGQGHETAIEFLKKLHPAGPWVLTAIMPDGPTKTRSFTLGQEQELLRFIRDHDGKQNLYYSINEPKALLSKKAAKADIKRVRYLHVDIDPADDETPAQLKERILPRLRAFQPAPSVIVDSGNGLQALWRLAEPIDLDGAASIAAVEEHNRALAKTFDCDPSTRNVDRIFRLPGTHNLPGKKKRRIGRVVCSTALIEINDAAYPLEAFKLPPLAEFTVADKATKGKAHDVETDVKSASDANIDIDALKISQRMKDLIRGIQDPKHPYKSRSEAVFAVLIAMAAAGHTDDQMAAVMLNTALPISGHVREQPKPREYLQRQAAQAREFAADPDVAKVNESYAVILVGGRVAIMRQSQSIDGELDFDLLTPSSFHTLLANKRVIRGEKSVPLAKHWLGHGKRRQYEGLVFAPGREVAEYFNLWCGFAVEPRPGDCSKFLAHLRDNVCRGNEARYRWVLGWFAQLFQEPGKKMGTSLVIRGRQGTGKTKVGEIIGSLLGPHYVSVSDPRYITGRFNSHLTRCVLLHADEGFWAGDHAAEGKLKDLVTGQHHLIEFKGKEPVRVRNHVRLLVTGNPDWLVPAGLEERRFAVLDIGEDRMSDHDYFAAIVDEMDNGGREALLDYLLHYDLKDIDLRTIPKTSALVEQKINSLTPEQGWLLDLLVAGTLPSGCNIARQTPCKLLFDHYIKHATSTGARRRGIETKIGLFLKKHVPGLSKVEGTYKGLSGKEEHGSIYKFPSLAECRANFAKLMQTEVKWDGPEEWLDPEGGQGDPKGGQGELDYGDPPPF